MIVTFYQFQYAEGGGTPARVGVVTGGDEDAARAFLCDKQLGGLEPRWLALAPCVTHWLPVDMYAGPVTDGKMSACWAGWRITDWVYGVGDGKEPSRPDGLIVTRHSVDGDFNGFDTRMAVMRMLITRDAAVGDIIDTLARAGMRFAGGRVRLALSALARAGRVTCGDDRICKAEVRRGQ